MISDITESSEVEQPQVESPHPSETELKRKHQSKFKKRFWSIMSGDVFSRDEFQSKIPYIVFVSLLSILYIYNGFYMNSLHDRNAKLAKQVKDLRAKSMTMKAIRMSSTRQSQIISEIQERGLPLEESLIPPRVISR